MIAPRFWVVPHTHWDREWYLPFEQFRIYLVQTVDEILDVLERDERMRFTLDGQTVLLEDYLEACPENEARLEGLVRAGRIEIGPSYQLPDEYLVSGESLVRNLLRGSGDCERYGARSEVGYAPDTFGHVSQLPQIFLGFGLDNLVFARGLGNEARTLGAVFRWRGFDGSELLAVRQLASYSNGFRLDGERVASFWDEFRARYEQVGLADILLCNGNDHSPVQADLPEVPAGIEAWSRMSTYSAYVAELRRVLPRRRLAVHSGELCGGLERPVLRGIDSARVYLKQRNEEIERRLLTVETLASLAVLAGREPRYRYPRAALDLAWGHLLRNHPHDSIGGCSVDRVHRDMLQRFDAARDIAEPLTDEAVAALCGREGVWGWEPRTAPEWTVANVLPWTRRGLVELDVPVVAEVPGFGVRSARAVVAEPVRAGKSWIENGAYRVEARRDGSLSVLDRRSSRRFDGLHVFEDVGDRGDEYTFCPAEGEAVSSGPVRARTTVTPVYAELELVRDLLLPEGLTAARRRSRRLVRCPVRTTVRLVPGAKRLEFRTAVENRARDHRLRVLFPTGARARSVRVEGHFAVLLRPTRPPAGKGWREPPALTHNTQGFVECGGLALFSRGLREYEAIPGRNGVALAVTLLRCVGWLSRDDLPTRPGHAGPPLETPEAQCPGTHVFGYALSLGGRRSDAELVRESQDYRFPLVAAPGACEELDPPLHVEGSGWAFSALKQAKNGDGLVLRLYNPSATDRAAVALDRPAARCRLDETAPRPPARRFTIAPGKIETLLLRP